ncbi:hypothetical protein [Salinicola socius]|uniref:Uncharacterized protein n=1 Tax=Salinicola socius TaxID=404433 RepID=A0A1Q8SV71_9GAMM|nr:hypothetical protein [Salinicola socius]OLO05307.1 hypothetical protein BTW07_04565 [Salinicola socius]
MTLNIALIEATDRTLRTYSTTASAADTAIKIQLLSIVRLDEIDKATQPFSEPLQLALLDVTNTTPERLLELLSAHYDAGFDVGERLADHVSLSRMKAACWMITSASQTIWQSPALENRYQELSAAASTARDNGDTPIIIKLADQITALHAANAATAKAWMA